MLNIYCFHGCGQTPNLFKSLLKSLEKNNKQHNWVYLKGFYPKDEGGWGWYKYKDTNLRKCDEKMEIDNSDHDYYSNMESIEKIIKYPQDTVLIGFSEGGQFALDLSQRFTNIRGVVAISPSYAIGIPKYVITFPVVLITSINDDRVMKKYLDKWKKHMKDNVTEINHFKGHKLYVPLETRNIIKDKMKL